MKSAARTWLFAIIALFSICTGYSQDVLIAAKKEKSWGYVDALGTFAIEPRFEEAFPFAKGFAVVKEKSLFTIIDGKGKPVISARKATINGEIGNNRITCQDDQGKWGVLDTKGKVRGAFVYDAISTYNGGFVVAGRKTSQANLFRMLVVDTLGSEVITFDNIFLPANSFSDLKKVRDGFVSVLVEGNYADQLTRSEWQLEGKPLFLVLLDVKNKKLINARIPSLQAEVHEGRLNLNLDGISYSWAAPFPTELTPSSAKFSSLSSAIYPFSGGIAAIAKDGNWAYVDKDGSVISETNLPVATYKSDRPLYYGGFVILQKPNGAFIFTDLNGKQKIAAEFEDAHPFNSGYAVVKSKGKYGLLLKDGSWALPPEYVDIRF